MTSEDKLGFETPCELMCPTINGYIINARSIRADVQSITKSEDIEECHKIAEEALWEVDRVEDNYEVLRDCLDNLRVWGLQWKELAKELIEKYEPELLEGE